VGNQGKTKRVAYLSVSGQPKDDEMLQSQLLKDLDLAKEYQPTLLYRRLNTYFPRFTQKGLINGNLWKIQGIQGENEMFWIGSSVCFESVLDVVVYNIDLMKRILVE
jgi:hypothetical protein